MAAQTTNTILVMTFAQADTVYKGFRESDSTISRGVRKAFPYIQHGATAVHKAMVTAFGNEGKTLAGFNLSTYKNAHAAAANLSKYGHELTDEDFDKWAVAAVRIVRTIKHGGVLKLTDTLATEGVGDNLEAFIQRADEIESKRTDERRDEQADKRAARPNDGSVKSDDDDDKSDDDKAPAGTAAPAVAAVASDVTSLREVSIDRLIREIEGRLRTGATIDVATIAHFDRMVEAYTERMAQPVTA